MSDGATIPSSDDHDTTSVHLRAADAVAATAADIAGLIAAAARLDGPAQSKATRALAGKCGAVRVWARWSTASSALMPLGIACLGIGIWDVATAVPVGTILVLGTGTLALSINVIGLWRTGPSAQQVALGLLLKAQDSHRLRAR
ncbi:hypothetical protein [Nocardia sp. NRRL S-836]|uniref:hypothetical protein n=1 Tax=Nocardia sp. NRRL S-836 TaxID=1519492 RepID=UPI0006ADCF11|nr:hypothetical protein [Nocardia sp. NRRL S-836]KOV84673.1 hypothetical protein ADL03_15430 [Nocardia sp. NRRL S-836]